MNSANKVLQKCLGKDKWSKNFSLHIPLNSDTYPADDLMIKGNYIYCSKCKTNITGYSKVDKSGLEIWKCPKCGRIYEDQQ